MYDQIPTLLRAHVVQPSVRRLSSVGGPADLGPAGSSWFVVVLGSVRAGALILLTVLVMLPLLGTGSSMNLCLDFVFAHQSAVVLFGSSSLRTPRAPSFLAGQGRPTPVTDVVAPDMASETVRTETATADANETFVSRVRVAGVNRRRAGRAVEEQAGEVENGRVDWVK